MQKEIRKVVLSQFTYNLDNYNQFATLITELQFKYEQTLMTVEKENVSGITILNIGRP